MTRLVPQSASRALMVTFPRRVHLLVLLVQQELTEENRTRHVSPVQVILTALLELAPVKHVQQEPSLGLGHLLVPLVQQELIKETGMNPVKPVQPTLTAVLDLSPVSLALSDISQAAVHHLVLLVQLELTTERRKDRVHRALQTLTTTKKVPLSASHVLMVTSPRRALLHLTSVEVRTDHIAGKCMTTFA